MTWKVKYLLFGCLQKNFDDPCLRIRLKGLIWDGMFEIEGREASASNTRKEDLAGPGDRLYVGVLPDKG